MDARKLQKQLENALVSGAKTFYHFNEWDPQTKLISFDELALVMKERSNALATAYADSFQSTEETPDDRQCSGCKFKIIGTRYVVDASFFYHTACYR